MSLTHLRVMPMRQGAIVINCRQKYNFHYASKYKSYNDCVDCDGGSFWVDSMGYL